MVPKTYTLDLRLTADHFAVKRGFSAPTTFAADAEATFEVLQDTSCLLLHAQASRRFAAGEQKHGRRVAENHPGACDPGRMNVWNICSALRLRPRVAHTPGKH